MVSADRINKHAYDRSSDFPAMNRSYQSNLGRRNINVSQVERWASVIGGGALAVFGLTRGSLGGMALALLGGGLIYRGATGHCDLYQALGINTSNQNQHPYASVQHGEGIKVENSVTINKPAAEVYRFWRDFQNLPRFMNHLESVQVIDSRRSHWVAKAPAGTTVEWDAEIINEKENELIAWRSLEGSTIPNAGSVRFEQAQDNRGCVVRVVVNYDPPGGVIGSTIAKLFGEEPGQQIEDDLRRLKQLMETGEIASTEGQSSGREAASRGASR